MSSPNDLPGEIKRTKFLNALKRLGFEINQVGGDGSHYKVIWPRNNKSVTVPQDLPKQTIRYVVKQIEQCSGITWQDIKDVL